MFLSGQNSNKVYLLWTRVPALALVWAVWPDGYIILSIFGPFQRWIFAQQHKKITEVGSQYCQMLNKLSKHCQRHIIFYQRGENLQKSGHTDSVSVFHCPIKSLQTGANERKKIESPTAEEGVQRQLAVWPDLAKFHHFGKMYKSQGNFRQFISYLAKFWAHFGKFVSLVGLIFIFANG